MQTEICWCSRRASRALAVAYTMLLFVPSVLSAQGAGGVEGRVTAADGSTPIGDVIILVRGTSRGTQTDAAGRFRVTGLAPARYTVVAQRIGHLPDSAFVDVRDGAVAAIQLALEEHATILAPTVVSATREAQRFTESSTTIDALDGATIRAARAAHPAGIMQRLPGVHATQLSGEGLSMAIRQPITTKPMYLYLEDGVPTRSTGFFNHNALYEINLPQAASVEVMKGPGTALYGSDAIGGVVNVLSRPAPVTPTVEASVEGGTYGYSRLLATAGMLRGNSGLRADLNVTRSDGWRDDAPYDRQSATVRWDASFGALTARTVVSGSNIDQSETAALSQAQFDARPTINPSPIGYRRVKALRFSSAIERERGRSLWSLTPYARYNDLDLMPTWQLTFDQQIWDTRNTSAGLLARYRRDFAPWQMRVIAGADLDLSPGSFVGNQITSTRDSSGVWQTFTTGAVQYDYDATYRQVSPYLHVEFTPVHRLRLDAGMRYDVSGWEYDSKLDPLQTGRWRRPADTTVTYRRLSPKVGATLDLGRAINVFAAYREGFRAPGQNQLFQQGQNVQSTVGLEPVTATSMEGGVRGQIGSRVVYSVSAYDMRVMNDIVTILDPQGNRTTSNAGETRHRGVESSLGAMLTPQLRFDAAYSSATHTYEEWKAIVSGANVSYNGHTIETAPHVLANALLTWSPALLGGGRLAVEWTHTGRYYGDPENTQTYDGFDLVSLHGSYQFRSSAELFARVTNATNEKYAEVATYNAFNRWQYTPGTPRSVFAGLRYTWQR